MNSANIYFADKSTIKVQDSDVLIPIVSHNENGDIYSSMDKPVELNNHINNGILPSLMDVFVKCDFFYLNHQYEVTYNSKSIVRIELS